MSARPPRKAGKRPPQHRPLGKQPIPRLPEGSRFDLRWQEGQWHGLLEVPDSPTFVEKAKTVFAIFCRLDRRYRAWLKERAATSAPPTDIINQDTGAQPLN
jgi:hypothetical protein